MRVLGLLVAVLGAAAMRAADPPAAAGDAMAAAKKDYAAIKPAPAPAESGPGLRAIDSRDDGPAAGVRPEAPTAARSGADPSKNLEGTGNWLVDAMETKSAQAQSSSGGDERIRGGLDFLRNAAGPDAGGEREAAPAGASGTAASRLLSESVYNPLDAFMSGWISAHDRELLLTPKRADSLMGGEPANAGAATLAGINLGSLGVPTDGGPARREPMADSRTAANPYIADLSPSALASPPVPDFPSFMPLALPDPSAGTSVSGAVPNLIDPAKSLVPDFAQPTDDDKYFRQMKRF
jgi:hypothetical protein